MPLAVFPKCFLPQLVDGRLRLEDWIKSVARELDVDGLEFYWPIVDGPSKRLRQVRELAESLGLQSPMMCYSPDFVQIEASARKREIREQKRAIAGTAALGGSFCRVLSGQRNPAVSRKDGIAMVAECIAELIPVAAEARVCLVLENHYKDGYWRFPEFAQRMDVFLELLAAIPSSPYFGVNFDPSNALLAGDDPIGLLQSVKDRVRTLHASDRFFAGGTLEDLRRIELHPQTGYASMLKHGVIGQGMIDYDRVFSILREIGFRGWISIEDGDDPAVGLEHLQASAGFLREKMAAYAVG